MRPITHRFVGWLAKISDEPWQPLLDNTAAKPTTRPRLLYSSLYLYTCRSSCGSAAVALHRGSLLGPQQGDGGVRLLAQTPLMQFVVDLLQTTRCTTNPQQIDIMEFALFSDATALKRPNQGRRRRPPSPPPSIGEGRGGDKAEMASSIYD